jgi:hypothetical protein
MQIKIYYNNQRSQLIKTLLKMAKQAKMTQICTPLQLNLAQIPSMVFALI